MIVPTLRNPIVFVHGMLGFDRLQVGGWDVVRYWSNIPDTFAAAGNRVYLARLSPLGSIAQRANQLKKYLDTHVPHEPVHLIAHSMGGLDARYMISKLGMASRVLSLTTIATPHQGTTFADWGLRRLEPVFRWLLDLCGISRQAFRDVTVARSREFNRLVPDAPGVRYFSVAGQFEADWLSPAWQLSWKVLMDAEGANDGLVSIASAAHGESCEIWPGDHFALLNYQRPLARFSDRWIDHTPSYGRLLGRLADEGF